MLILYLSIQLIDGSNVKVKIDREVFNFDSGGKIHIVGFFGIYSANENEESNYGRSSVNLNGEAFYVRINAEPNYDVDDSYLSIVESLDNITHPLDKSPLELTDEDLESLAYLSDTRISSGSFESAAHRNGPFPSQKRGRI